MTVLAHIVLAVLLPVAASAAQERKPPMETPSPGPPAHTDPNTAVATFAAGCFWGVEHFFAQVPGVLSTQVGYTGGRTKNPTYKDVCRGDTNHAEAVQLIYDPNQVRYETLVRLFFKMHDPTTRNRQGPDIGSQYRSAVFVHTEDQKKTALTVIKDLTGKRIFRRPIVTQVAPLTAFWPAEDYHQQYFKKNPGRRCHINFSPTLID